MKPGSAMGKFAVAALVALASPAIAEWAPKGSLTLQIGFGAGGSTDVIGRVLGKVMEEQTGWNVVVENKPGGGGVAMFAGIANRPAQGSVIGMGVNMPILVNLLRRGDELGFNIDSFDYLATVALTPVAIVAMSDAPFDDLPGMIEYAKSNDVSVAHAALPQKLAMDAVTRTTGSEFNLVSTEGGSEIMKLLLGGQVMTGFSSGEHFPYTDQMKVIGTTSASRLGWAPDAPTFLESGVGIFVDPYFYIATTAGTDPEAVAALSEAINNALNTDEVAEIIENAVNNKPANLGPEGTKQMFMNGIENIKVLFTE